MKKLFEKKCVTLMLSFALCAAFSSNALAIQISTAPGYAQASHGSAAWQQLGQNSSINDGVSWSVNGGAYGHDNIIAGKTVTFKFDQYKQHWGRHQYDAIRVWVDWNQDHAFSPGEMILSNFRNIASDPHNPVNDSPVSPSDALRSFYSTVVAPVVAPGTATNFWLRARVACDESMGHNMNNLTPYGYLNQGEVEDWNFTIKPSSVPEPSTMLLLSLGLGGAAILRRKFNK